MVAPLDSGRAKTFVIRAGLVSIAVCGVFLSHVAANWEQWSGCQWDRTRYFDGDSFHIIRAGHQHVIRLYFADAPETDRNFPGRLSEQAAYFGVTENEVLSAGLEARELTARFLARPFRVTTRREPAPGVSRTPRLYALIERDGLKLHEALVAAGLARATAPPAAFPTRSAGTSETLRLRQLERAAAHARKGLWRSARARIPPLAGSPSRVNLNTATRAQLESLPGIGPKLAERIIASRPLRDVAALDRVPGIGEKKIALLRARIDF